MRSKDDVIVMFTRMICMVVMVMVVSACIGGLWYGKPITASPFAEHLESIMSSIIGFIAGSFNRNSEK